MTDPTTQPALTPVLALASVQPEPRPEAFMPPEGTRGRFDMRRATLGPQLGLGKLGCSLHEVSPGCAAYPFHSHRANDELFHVLDGHGELRLGGARHPVQAGDLVGCPAGGPSTAHQLVNTGAAPLRYLAISTLQYPEVCEYPDSAKVAAYDWRDPADGVVHFGRAETSLDYWDGE